MLNALNHFYHDEKGATLVVAILVLVALTVIGLSAVTSSNLSMDVSGNLKAKTTAYHAAEACMYYQIQRIKTSGAGTTALNYTLGSNLSCTASAPTSSGGSSSGGYLDGYSLESGSASVGFAAYQFTVTGLGPRNTTSIMTVGINLPAAGGGY